MTILIDLSTLTTQMQLRKVALNCTYHLFMLSFKSFIHAFIQQTCFLEEQV